ncbi:hypothetical protein HH310_28965 [Actinoplanes sp. TBRC 11911]|uniref:hypothetical protein n=1 Tax=Actinoplanes sp. TBRC 11911 TaxID=2729386 RepID=UPI00145D8FBF|nr:hypothetical protein [Actinoplanes sp. TBRC 11911]NMO55203.1 hypothetical protein [Actinoplanes sp. TBRC 11911]
MTFRADSSGIRVFAAELRESYSEVELAKNYLHRHGDFGFHQAGVIGLLAGQHRGFLAQLEELHNQLLTILWRSGEALTEVAVDYDDTDKASAVRADAAYPAVPRPVPSRD